MKNGYMTCVVKYNGHDNYLYGMELNDGRFRFVHFNMGTSSFGAFRYVSALAQIIRAAQTNSAQSTVTPPQQQALSSKSGGWPKQGATAPPSQPQRPSASQQPSSQPAFGEEPRTTPAATNGTASSYLPEMTGLYLHEEYGSGVGGMITISYEPYILFPDGTITSDLYYIPNSQADMAQWRARKPKWWGTWTKEGEKISIRWNDPRSKPETWERWFAARPGTEAMALTGLYRSMGGGGNTALGGNIMIAAWKDFKFSPGGTVVKGGGSGSMNSGPGASVATASNKQPAQANYLVHPYTIELHYADGHSERQWFYRFPDSDDVIGIGGSTYIKDK